MVASQIMTPMSSEQTFRTISERSDKMKHFQFDFSTNKSKMDSYMDHVKNS
jgi:hypothetical protein